MLELKEAHEVLRNWGRYVSDSWLRDNLLFTNPPTSDGYIAPVVAYDDPEPATQPIDELDAQRTEAIIIEIGRTPGFFDCFRVLQYWFTIIPRDYKDVGRERCIKLLAKHMHSSYGGAERMLRDSVARFWCIRQAAVRKTA